MMINKYKNKKIEYNGIKFDSKKEMNYYIKLLELESQGKINNLQLQVPFILQEKYKLNNKTIREISYIADFVYYDQYNQKHIADVKGIKTEVYKLKKKLFEYKYQIEIEEI